MSQPAFVRRRMDLALFALLSWLHMLVQTWPYLRGAAHDGLPAWLFQTQAWLGYSLLYLLPALLPLALLAPLLKYWPRTLAILAAVTSAGCALFIQADSTIYDLYSFHFNGFVLNLLTTPGGIASLGSGSDTWQGIAILTLRTFAVQGLFAWLALRRALPERRSWPRWCTAALTAVLIGQALQYGVSDIRNHGAILDGARRFPFYSRVTFRGLAARVGVKADRNEKMAASIDVTRLNYPRQPIDYRAVATPPNIVLLVAESLRWDRLTPEIMPNTWAMAQRAQHFTRHYSSGNGTREGLFGLFYGLYGAYWESFLHAQRGPLLMDRVQALNYQLDLRTSAKFSYPEFNRTLFATVPLQVQHEADDRLTSWQNDEANTAAAMRFIAQRDRSRPFMSFVFYESTHARYNFPEQAAIARPYLESIDYSRMSKASLAPHVDQLKNRYTNAAHWIDVQLGRIYAELERQNLLDNTIVIVTGDHGEEFFEKGFWGHNSSFVEEQTHTPLVVSMPGHAPAQIERLTSHLDIATTLLQALGAPAETANYSLGRNLFDATPRAYLVMSDWHSIGVFTGDMKYRIAYQNRGTDHWQPTALDDRELAATDAARKLAENRGVILDAIQNCSAFSRKTQRSEDRAAARLADVRPASSGLRATVHP